jgi:hypothetical protein
MSQNPEKYLYFQVGLLKNSFALDALRQDALKYHMVDQPGQLIALRLTEYYEMMARGILPPGVRVPMAATPTASGRRGDGEEVATASSPGINGTHPLTGQVDASHLDDESVVVASPDADQNAEEAAEYWARL